MNHAIRVFFTIVSVIALLSPASAEVSSVSVEKREKELSGLIKECAGQNNIRPEATIKLQNPATSSLAQPTVSTLAQPHETFTMTDIMDFIKTTTNIVNPDEKLKSE